MRLSNLSVGYLVAEFDQHLAGHGPRSPGRLLGRLLGRRPFMAGNGSAGGRKDEKGDYRCDHALHGASPLSDDTGWRFRSAPLVCRGFSTGNDRRLLERHERNQSTLINAIPGTRLRRNTIHSLLVQEPGGRKPINAKCIAAPGGTARGLAAKTWRKSMRRAKPFAAS